MGKKSATYKGSGVDIQAGEDIVNSIRNVVRETHNESVLADIGGFGGFYKPELSGYEEPVFVSSVDGVGTKLIVAFRMGRYDTVGQDLVNHCVNDIAVCGARPLFFLDYFSTGKLEHQVGVDVVKGIAKACKENGVALIGGETAEMPDLYSEGEFDLAGTIVGIADRSGIITGDRIRKGDVLLGFRSTGLHTNGYSLARKVFFTEYEVTDEVEELGTTLGDALLAVHKSYLAVINKLKEIEGVHGFSHITGGGIIGNTKRIVPEGFKITVDWNAWERPPIFDLIQELGGVPEDDMRSAFNLGVGLVVVVDPGVVGEVEKKAREMGEDVIRVGEIN